MVGRNGLAFFELKPSFNENAERFDGRNMTIRTWTLPLFYVVTAAGLVGFWLGRRNRFVLVMAATALYFTVTSLFFVAPPRLHAAPSTSRAASGPPW